VTTKSTKKKEVLEKMYTYSQISTSLFIGYIKDENALIALPEKALLDQLYMIVKGLKTKQYLDEMDYSVIDKTKFLEYFKLIPDQLAKSIKEIADKYMSLSLQN